MLKVAFGGKFTDKRLFHAKLQRKRKAAEKYSCDLLYSSLRETYFLRAKMIL